MNEVALKARRQAKAHSEAELTCHFASVTPKLILALEM